MIAIKPRLRRALTTAAVLVVAVPLAGCTFNTTDTIYTPAQGVNDRGGDVDVLNALIVSSADGEGRLIAGLVNNNLDQEDSLEGVTGVEEDSSVQTQGEGGETTIPAGGLLQLADEGSVRITVTGDDVQPGQFIRLTLEFAEAEPVTVHVPVVEPGEDFADVVSSSPSASPTDGETTGGETTGGEAESPAPTESELPAPTESASPAAE